MKYHLAILEMQYINYIIAGEKNIELRLTKAAVPPFGKIEKGDKIFLKASSKAVLAIATADKVVQMDKMTPSYIRQLKTMYNDAIMAKQNYWQVKKDAKFATLIWLKDIIKIPQTHINKTNRQSWVILSERKNYGLLAKYRHLLYAQGQDGIS